MIGTNDLVFFFAGALGGGREPAVSRGLLVAVEGGFEGPGGTKSGADGAKCERGAGLRRD